MTVGEFSYSKVSCIWAFLSVSLVVNNVQKNLGYFYFITHDEKLSVHTVVNITTNIQLVEKALASLGFSGLFAAGTVICWCQRTHTWSCACLFYFITHHEHWTAWICQVWSISGRKKTWFCLSFFDCFYIALFSALEQTHCARMRF